MPLHDFPAWVIAVLRATHATFLYWLVRRVHNSCKAAGVSNAGVTRIPVAVEAYSAAPEGPRSAWCTGTLRDMLQDGSVLASFALSAQSPSRCSAIAGFQAKARGPSMGLHSESEELSMCRRIFRSAVRIEQIGSAARPSNVLPASQGSALHVAQVMHAQTRPAAEPAAPPEARYTIIWQAERAMLRSPQRARSCSRCHTTAVQWLAGAGRENNLPFPGRFAIRDEGHVRQRSRAGALGPAGQALRSVSWLQAAVRGSRPGAELRLRTRGALSFPHAQDGPGAHRSATAHRQCRKSLLA